MGSKIRQVRLSSEQRSNKRVGSLLFIAEKALSIYLIELHTQLNDMLSNADDHLFDKSSKSDDSRHFIALRTIRVKKEGLLKCFSQEMINYFRVNIGDFDDSLFKTPAEIESLSVEGESIESLSLVDEEDLERQIAIDTMVVRSRQDNAKALENIRQRLEEIMPSISISGDMNPFDPSFVAYAFSTALSPIHLDLEFELVLLKYFERNVVHELDLLYQDVNNVFIEQGVLPGLTLDKSHRINSRLAKSDKQTTLSSKKQSASNNQEILSLLTELLTARRSSAENIVPQQVNTDDLIKVLSNIQVALSDNEVAVDMSNVVSLHNVRKQISNHLPVEVRDKLANGGLGQFNDDMIDVVTMLFDFILDDDNLKSEVKAVLSRLQIPILKVGLVDKSFFSNRKHAARLLLNELAHAGLTWEPDDPSSKIMLETIQSIVETVSTEFSDNVTIFEQLLKEFLNFKQSHLKRSIIFEKRTREAEEGKARAEGARGRVNQELHKICHKKQVPEVVQQILKQVWVHVMFLEALRADENSWVTVCKLARMLVWSVQPFNTQLSLNKLTKTIPVLIKNLNLGFNKISFSQIESSGLLDRLEILHRERIKEAKAKILEDNKDEVLRLKPLSPFDEVSQLSNDREIAGNLQEDIGSEITVDKVVTEAVPIENVVIEDIVIEDIAFSKEQIGLTDRKVRTDVNVTQSSIDSVENLHAGSWLELRFGDDFKRCKLAAKIVSSGKFIFVNRSGIKVAEYLTNELAVEYQVGNLKLLDDEALFDRALESVISSLRTMKAVAE